MPVAATTKRAKTPRTQWKAIEAERLTRSDGKVIQSAKIQKCVMYPFFGGGMRAPICRSGFVSNPHSPTSTRQFSEKSPTAIHEVCLRLEFPAAMRVILVCMGGCPGPPALRDCARGMVVPHAISARQFPGFVRLCVSVCVQSSPHRLRRRIRTGHCGPTEFVLATAGHGRLFQFVVIRGWCGQFRRALGGHCRRRSRSCERRPGGCPCRRIRCRTSSTQQSKPGTQSEGRARR